MRLLSGGRLRGQILEAKTCRRHCRVQEMAYVLPEQDPWLHEQGWHRDGIYPFTSYKFRRINCFCAKKMECFSR